MNGWIEEGRKKGREEGKKTGNDVGKERGRRESEGTDGWCNSEKTICCLPLLDLLLEGKYWSHPSSDATSVDFWRLSMPVHRGRQTKEAATAAAKSLQSCPTVCDPIDGSPLGSAIPGILQARTLEWIAISFSNVWKWEVKVKWLSHVQLLATPWTAAYQAPPSMGFSRQEYWSGVHCLLRKKEADHSRWVGGRLNKQGVWLGYSKRLGFFWLSLCPQLDQPLLHSYPVFLIIGLSP